MSVLKALRPPDGRQFKRKRSALSDLLPYVFFVGEKRDGAMLQWDGSFSRAYRFVAPDLASSGAAKIAGIAGAFNHAIKRLGEGWCVQLEVQRRRCEGYLGATFNNLAGYLVDRQREINFTRRGDRYETEYYLIFTYRIPDDVGAKAKSLFFAGGKRRGAGLSRERIDGELQSFLSETAKAVAPLSARMRVEPLDDAEYLTLLHSCVSLNWHKMAAADPGDLNFVRERICDADLFTTMPMKLGDFYIPIVCVNSFPSATVPAMFDSLNKADCEYRWSTRFVCCGRELAKKRIDRKRSAFLSARKSVMQYVVEAASPDLESDKEDSGAMVQAADADSAMEELAAGIHAFGDYTSDIMVWDEDLDSAREKAKYVSQIVGGCGFAASEETFNARDAFLSMLPGDMRSNVRRDFVSTGNLSHIIPISSVWAGMRENLFTQKAAGSAAPLLICSTDYRVPFFLNLNVMDVGHTWISGPTGSGKSTLLALLECQHLKYRNAQVVIFDKDLSARNLTMCVGGIYHVVGREGGVTFQPLKDLDTQEDRMWACEFVETCLSEQKMEVTASVRKAVVETLGVLSGKERAARTISAFCQYCSYVNPKTGERDVAAALAPYTREGQFGALFDNSETNLPLSRWVMFEMNELMKMSSAAATPALLFMFREVERMFDGSLTLLVLDEAWIFLKNEAFARKITDWLKTLRKKNVFVIFATQEIADAVNSPIASTIVSQCASKIYLADDQATTSLSREAYLKFGLDEAEIERLAECQKQRDYFYKSSLGARRFQLDLEGELDGGLQLGVLTCGAKDRALLDEIEAKFGRNSGKPLVGPILDAKGIKWRHLLPPKERGDA